MLESVKNLVKTHGDILRMIVNEMEAVGYYVSWRLLDTHRYSGIPHRRQRFFLLAFKTAGTWPARGGRDQFPFHVVWPRPIPCQELSSILDPVPVVVDYNMNPCTQKYPRMNLAKALHLVKTKAKRERRNPSDYCVVVDLGGGPGSGLTMGWDETPCLSWHRGRQRAFWSLQHGRPLNVRELCKLQGLDINEMIVEGSTCAALGTMLGNAYSCTMIARVLASGLQSLGRASRIEENVLAEDEDSGDGSLLGYDSYRGALGPGGFLAGKAVSTGGVLLCTSPALPWAAGQPRVENGTRGLATGGRGSG